MSESVSADDVVFRSVAVSAGAQFVAKAANLAMNVVASLALIRFLGPAGYGDYAFVLGFSAIFGLLSDFGLPKVAVREMARTPSAAPAVLGSAIWTRLVLAVASLCLAQFVLLVFGLKPELRSAVAVASLLFVIDALLSITAVFQVRLAGHFDALVTIVSQAIDTVLILWLVSQHGSLLQLIAAPVAAGGLGVGLAVMLARTRFRARVTLELRRAPDLLRAAAPVGLTLLLAVIYLKLDNVLLGVMSTPESVGLYAAAFKPIEYLLLASGVVLQPAFPLLSRWYGVDTPRFTFVHQRGIQALFALVAPVTVVLVFTGRPLLGAVYAPEFAQASLPLAILGVALLFMNVNVWQGFTLLAAGRQRVTLLYDFAGLVVNLVLNVALIPRLSYLGAALAALLTSAFVAVTCTFAVRRLLNLTPDTLQIARVSLAAALLAGVLWALLAASVPWFLAAVLACCTYPAWLLLCRVTTLHELSPRPARAGVG